MGNCADFTGRPINKHCFADNFIKRQHTPILRIGGVVAVIAQNKYLRLAYTPFAAVAGSSRDVGLIKQESIYVNIAGLDLDDIARCANDPLDKSPVWIEREVKYDNVASLWFTPPISQPVDHNKFAVMQARLHTVALNADARGEQIDSHEQQAGDEQSL